MKKRKEFNPKQWKEVARRNGRVLMRSSGGDTKIVKIDKEGIKRGDYLQPVGKMKDDFVKIHGWLPHESREDIKRYLARRGELKKYDPTIYNHPENMGKEEE